MAKKSPEVTEKTSSENQAMVDALNNALSLINGMDAQIATLNEQVEQLKSQLSNNRS